MQSLTVDIGVTALLMDKLNSVTEIEVRERPLCDGRHPPRQTGGGAVPNTILFPAYLLSVYRLDCLNVASWWRLSLKDYFSKLSGGNKNLVRTVWQNLQQAKLRNIESRDLNIAVLLQ